MLDTLLLGTLGSNTNKDCLELHLVGLLNTYTTAVSQESR